MKIRAMPESSLEFTSRPARHETQALRSEGASRMATIGDGRCFVLRAGGFFLFEGVV
jgi:hypothetical protein